MRRYTEEQIRDKMKSTLMYPIYNKELKIYGQAFGMFGGEAVRVFEGNPDGSDDRIYTIEEFIEKYVIMEHSTEEYEEELE